MAKPKEYEVIQTRIKPELYAKVKEYLSLRGGSYNSLVNHLLYEKFYGLTDRVAIHQVMHPVQEVAPLPPKPDEFSSGEHIYTYMHHPHLTGKAATDFKRWMEFVSMEVVDRVEEYERSIGANVKPLPPPQTIEAAIALSAARAAPTPVVEKPPVIRTPPLTDVDLSDIDFEE